jgi:hypothetical protein
MPPRVKKKIEPIEVPVKQKQVTNRWERIQETRKKNVRTGEPVPGSLGVAYLYNTKKGGFEKVAVLSRNRDGKVRIQRAIGGQFTTVGLSYLRTNEELWEGIRGVDPALLPKSRVDPNTRRQWDPTKLAPAVLTRVFKETE